MTVVLCTRHDGRWICRYVHLHSFLTSVVAVGCMIRTPYPRGQNSGTCRIANWVGPPAILDAVTKTKMTLPCQESNSGFLRRPAQSRLIIPTRKKSREILALNLNHVWYYKLFLDERCDFRTEISVSTCTILKACSPSSIICVRYLLSFKWTASAVLLCSPHSELWHTILICRAVNS